MSGWDEAARRLGVGPVCGIENDANTCRTRRAAGHWTWEADVLDVEPFQHVGQIASAPCQSFSVAGLGAGRRALDDVLGLVAMLAADPWAELRWSGDSRTRLVVEPLRWALRARPEWLAWEQVPTVLPVWRACARVMEKEGWSVVTGILRADEYGVPQTRRRAILVAHRGSEAVRLPTTTHTKYRKGGPRADPGLLPWVSMIDALGWGATHRPAMTVTSGGARTGGAEPFGNQARAGLRRERDAGRWVDSPRGPDVRINVAEAAVLQGFPAGYPWSGKQGKVFEQIGNAVPVRLAEAVLREVACDE